MEEKEYNYEDILAAAKEAVDAVFDEQTQEDAQEVFGLSKEVYEEGAEAVSSMAGKVEAIGQILIAMAKRIWGGSRAVENSPFDQVVTRAIDAL